MLVRKISVGVEGVFICCGVLSVRSRGPSLFVAGDGEVGGWGESPRLASSIGV